MRIDLLSQNLHIVSWYDITIAALNQDTSQVPFLRRFSYSSISCQEVGQRTSPSDGKKIFRIFNLR